MRNNNLGTRINCALQPLILLKKKKNYIITLLKYNTQTILKYLKI